MHTLFFRQAAVQQRAPFIECERDAAGVVELVKIRAHEYASAPDEHGGEVERAAVGDGLVCWECRSFERLVLRLVPVIAPALAQQAVREPRETAS